MRRTRKTNASDSFASTSDREPAAAAGLDVSLSILKLVLENVKVKFSKIASSPEFIPILHYCAISIKRFCKNVPEEVENLLDSATKCEEIPLAEELFIIEIFIQNNISYTDNLAEKVTAVIKDFVKDLQLAQNKTKDCHFLEGATPKPKGSRQVDDLLPDKQLIAVFAKSEMEFWTLVMEFNRYSVVNTLIQELNRNRALPFPTDFLLAQFRGSVDTLNVFKTYISNFFDQFFSDDRWFPFIEQTPELIEYIINDVFPLLERKSVNKCGPLYVPFLKQFFDQIFLGRAKVETFIQFVTITGDENFINVLDTREDIASAFQEFFLTHFDALFSNKDWCAFIQGSQLIIKFIVLHMYNNIPKEKHRMILDFNEELLDNILLDEDVQKTISFIVDLPVDFMIYQFTENNPTASQFRSLFIINFDSYITNKELYTLIVSSDELLTKMITDVIPFCTETKQRKVCQEMYETYLKTRLNEADRNLIPLATFVEGISKTVPIEWLRFNNLSPSMQISLFNYVSSGLTANELANHKNLYTEFYIPFLQVPSLMTMLPESLKTAFFNTVVIPYVTTNTLRLTPIQTYNLSLILVEDPFADQERCEFFQFLVKNVDELLPVIMKDPRIMKYCWGCIIRSEKDLRASMNRDFIFRFCVIYLQMDLPNEPKLFQLASANFYIDNYEKHVTHSEKSHILMNLSLAFTKAIESKLSDRLALKNYQDAVTELIMKLSADSYFCESVEFAMNKSNKGFMKILMDIFAREKDWLKLFAVPQIFLKFSEIVLELFPQVAKNSFFTYDRYDEIMIIFNRCSIQISQNDVLREAFLTYFLSNESKLDRFLSCVNQPLHKPMFYTEFSDQQKNSILTSIFTTFLEQENDDIPIHTIWNTYINAMSFPFIHLKNHEQVYEKVRDAFIIPSQEEFDQMFQMSKKEDITNALYKVSRTVGLQTIMNLRNTFRNLEVDPERNCFNEVFEDIFVRYIPENRNDTPEELKRYEDENPRYRAFSSAPPKYFDMVLGIISLALIFYLNILGFSSSKVAGIVCGILASIFIVVITYPSLYFANLKQPGWNAWFFVRCGFILAIIALSFATYILRDSLTNHAAFIFLDSAFCALTIYDIVKGVEDLRIEWPEKEEEDANEGSEKSGSNATKNTKTSKASKTNKTKTQDGDGDDEEGNDDDKKKPKVSKAEERKKAAEDKKKEKEKKKRLAEKKKKAAEEKKKREEARKKKKEETDAE